MTPGCRSYYLFLNIENSSRIRVDPVRLLPNQRIGFPPEGIFDLYLISNTLSNRISSGPYRLQQESLASGCPNEAGLLLQSPGLADSRPRRKPVISILVDCV